MKARPAKGPRSVFFCPGTRKPHRLQAALVDAVAELGGEREVAVARELTKVHEELFV